LATGAARGLGAACAQRFAARGHRVALVGVEGAALEDQARMCGPDALAYEADVRDPEELRAAVAERSTGSARSTWRSRTRASAQWGRWRRRIPARSRR
jgi:NAD(P)-dependent dehydrogenase (short-subunit alcohol dehydrogenase family)